MKRIRSSIFSHLSCRLELLRFSQCGFPLGGGCWWDRYLVTDCQTVCVKSLEDRIRDDSCGDSRIPFPSLNIGDALFYPFWHRQVNPFGTQLAMGDV